MPCKINGKKKPHTKARYSKITEHRTFITKKKERGKKASPVKTAQASE